MEQRTRSILLGAGTLIVVVLIGAWWWSGFTLDFMRFFASEPGALQRSIEPLPSGTNLGVIGCRNIPPGCTCQQVQCIQAPCNPIIVCPSATSGIVSCSPATQTVSVGSSAQLTASGGTADAYQWFAPEGALALPDPAPGSNAVNFVAVQYSAPGVKKVTVQSSRGDGIHTDSVACTVVVTP